MAAPTPRHLALAAMAVAAVAGVEGDGDGVTDEAVGAGVVAGAPDSVGRVAGSDGFSGPATTSPSPATAARAIAASARCRGVGAAMATDLRRCRLNAQGRNPREQRG